MTLDTFITESLLTIKANGLRPKKVHFDVYAHHNLDTGEMIILSGAVTADGTPVDAPKPQQSKDISGARVSFSIPVIDWGA